MAPLEKKVSLCTSRQNLAHEESSAAFAAAFLTSEEVQKERRCCHQEQAAHSRCGSVAERREQRRAEPAEGARPEPGMGRDGKGWGCPGWEGMGRDGAAPGSQLRPDRTTAAGKTRGSGFQVLV